MSSVPKRLAEVVAARIEDDILARGLPAGFNLGSESDLMAEMGVGRAVLREALRIVEHHELARMRRGSGGGLIVADPDSRAVLRAVELYLGFHRIDDDHLLEARTALELLSVRTAAEKISPSGIERLREALDRERSLARRTIEDEHPRDLHVVLAELSGNPALTLFISVLAELARSSVVESGTDIEREIPHYLRAHELIAEAVMAGDASAAQYYMRRHLESVAAASRPSGSS